MRPLELFLTIGAGLVVNAAITPLIIRLAHRNHWYDEKNHRKIHTHDTPRIGGVGIFIGFIAAIGVVAIFQSTRTPSDAIGWPFGSTSTFGVIAPPLIGLVIVHLLGLVDDFRNLRAIVKLFLQILAAAIVTLGPYRIERVVIPFIWYQLDLGGFSYVVTIIWIVAISNAINFIDGVDGLAGGVSAIAALFFGVLALLTGNGVVALLAVGLFGSIVGFLIYNAPQARIFMGDSGAYVLGFVLSLFSLVLAEGGSLDLDLIPAVTILAVPVLDMTTAVVRRLSRGKHPFTADREHLHHKLMDVGFGTWSVLAIAYTSSLVLGIVAVLWFISPLPVALIATIVAWAVAIALLVVLTRAQRTHQDATTE